MKKKDKISLICPTFNRSEKHINLYQAFVHQDYSEKELLVLDDSLEPSSFFNHLQDKRVVYRHIPFRMSIGAKRNLLIDLSSGDLIAHFDDDDYYAPSYLAEMHRFLGDKDFATLSRWLAWRELDGTLWEWDTTFVASSHFAVSGSSEILPIDHFLPDPEARREFLDKNLWGYGFSYLYRKTVWEAAPFEDINHGEDYAFVCEARKGGFSLVHSSDLRQLSLHLIHPKSSSRIFPQVQLDSSKAIEIFGSSVRPWISD